MNIKKTTHKTKHTASLKLSGLTLVDIVVAAMLVFPTALWSQTAEWKVYNTANSGLPYNGVTGLAVDARDNIWVGTGKWYAFEGGGLAKFDRENWSVYNTSNSGLPSNRIWALDIDAQDNIWIGTYGGGLVRSSMNWYMEALDLLILCQLDKSTTIDKFLSKITIKYQHMIFIMKR